MLFMNTFMKKRIIIAETERALLFKDEQFVDVLMPGVHIFRDWKNQLDYVLEDISETLEEGVDDEVMKVVKLHPEKMAKHVQVWETGEHEVGLIYQKTTSGKAVLKEIKAPSQQGAYWTGFFDIEVRKVNISDDFKLDKTLARVILAAKQPLLRNSAVSAITTSTIPARHLVLQQHWFDGYSESESS